MSEITPFNFNGHAVRVIIIDGEPWWVAADVCEALEISNVTQAVGRLDEADLCQAEVSSGGQGRSVNVINESGLYELIVRSDKPAAKPFRRWVTTEVLPSIRKTGGYLPVQFDPDMQRIFDLTVGMQITRDEQRRLAVIQSEQGEVLQGVVADVAGVTADVADLKAASPLVDTEHLHTLRDVAHACGTGQNRLSGWLQGGGILFRDHQGGLRVKQHPWVERGWALDRWERWSNGQGFSWITYFTPSGLLEVKRRYEAAGE